MSIRDVEIDLGYDAGDWRSALKSVLERHRLSDTPVEGICIECVRPYPCDTVRDICDAVFFDFDERLSG